MKDLKVKLTHLKMLENFNRGRVVAAFLQYLLCSIGGIIIGYFFCDFSATQTWVSSAQVESIGRDVMLLKAQNESMKVRLGFVDAVVSEMSNSEEHKRKVGEIQASFQKCKALHLLNELSSALKHDVNAALGPLDGLKELLPAGNYQPIYDGVHNLHKMDSLKNVFLSIKSISEQGHYQTAEISDLDTLKQWLEDIVMIRKAHDIAQHIELQRMGGVVMQLFKQGEIRAVFLIAERLKKQQAFAELHQVLLPVMHVLKMIEDNKLMIEGDV
jgi:hypothetical protein